MVVKSIMFIDFDIDSITALHFEYQMNVLFQDFSRNVTR